MSFFDGKRESCEQLGLQKQKFQSRPVWMLEQIFGVSRAASQRQQFSRMNAGYELMHLLVYMSEIPAHAICMILRVCTYLLGCFAGCDLQRLTKEGKHGPNNFSAVSLSVCRCNGAEMSLCCIRQPRVIWMRRIREGGLQTRSNHSESLG